MNSRDEEDHQPDENTGEEKPTPFQASMAEYRRQLQKLKDEMQNAYDKHLLTLSAGALVLSITFIKETLQHEPSFKVCLSASWVFWGIAICCIVGSFLTSFRAMTTAISQTDDHELYLAANRGELGGCWDRWTRRLNLLGGVAFFAGVLTMIVFALGNLHCPHQYPVRKMKNRRQDHE